MEVWHLGTWFSAGAGSAGLVVGLADPRGLFQQKLLCSQYQTNCQQNRQSCALTLVELNAKAELAQLYHAEQESLMDFLILFF